MFYCVTLTSEQLNALNVMFRYKMIVAVHYDIQEAITKADGKPEALTLLNTVVSTLDTIEHLKQALTVWVFQASNSPLGAVQCTVNPIMREHFLTILQGNYSPHPDIGETTKQMLYDVTAIQPTILKIFEEAEMIDVFGNKTSVLTSTTKPDMMN